MKDTQNQEQPPELNTDQPRRTTTAGYDESKGSSGITNRPLEKEEENQDRLPPRGEEKR